MLQTILVSLIVLGASGYSIWKLAPAAWRNRLAAQTGSLARATGASETLARQIEIKAVNAAANAGGCGSCGPCKGCAVGQAKDEGDPAA